MRNGLSKKDQGALLFQTWNNKLQERLNDTDKRGLRLAYRVCEMKRRLDCLEQIVFSLRGELHRDLPQVEFFCIACGKHFNIPEPEAKAQEYMTVCPDCHNWALPTRDDDSVATISGKQIAEETGRSYSFVCQLARENELGHCYGRRTKLYTNQEKDKLVELLEKHPAKR